MKKLLTCLIFTFLAVSKLSAYAGDLDSLKQKLQLTSDSLKGPIYIAIAQEYMHYDTVSNRNLRHYYKSEALNYSMLALHVYSGMNDSLGMRTCYNTLSKIYRSQHIYSQAKWFILQSNTISRLKHDVPNIIASLIELSAIKSDIKDYTLAMGDLNEALKIAVKNKDPRNESAVQVGYADLYRHMKNYDKAAVAIKRHEFLDDSIQKAEETKLAMVNKKDSVQIKKQDSIIVKKKVYTSSFKRGSKLASARHTVSL
jgi:tetratricopeptide (TPR) repeat protein